MINATSSMVRPISKKRDVASCLRSWKLTGTPALSLAYVKALVTASSRMGKYLSPSVGTLARMARAASESGTRWLYPVFASGIKAKRPTTLERVNPTISPRLIPVFIAKRAMYGSKTDCVFLSIVSSSSSVTLRSLPGDGDRAVVTLRISLASVTGLYLSGAPHNAMPVLIA